MEPHRQVTWGTHQEAHTFLNDELSSLSAPYKERVIISPAERSLLFLSFFLSPQAAEISFIFSFFLRGVGWWLNKVNMPVLQLSNYGMLIGPVVGFFFFFFFFLILRTLGRWILEASPSPKDESDWGDLFCSQGADTKDFYLPTAACSFPPSMVALCTDDEVRGCWEGQGTQEVPGGTFPLKRTSSSHLTEARMWGPHSRINEVWASPPPWSPHPADPSSVFRMPATPPHAQVWHSPANLLNGLGCVPGHVGLSSSPSPQVPHRQVCLPLLLWACLSAGC